jgi:hypothetical protein
LYVIVFERFYLAKKCELPTVIAAFPTAFPTGLRLELPLAIIITTH